MNTTEYEAKLITERHSLVDEVIAGRKRKPAKWKVQRLHELVDEWRIQDIKSVNYWIDHLKKNYNNMKKDKIKGGLRALVKGNDQVIVTPETLEPATPEKQELPTDGGNDQTATLTAKREELIETFTDEEVREKLRTIKAQKAGRPKRGAPVRGSKIGNGYSHVTYTLTDKTANKVRTLAALTGFNASEVVEAALNKAIASYEDKNGKITVISKSAENLF